MISNNFYSFIADFEFEFETDFFPNLKIGILIISLNIQFLKDLTNLSFSNVLLTYLVENLVYFNFICYKIIN